MLFSSYTVSQIRKFHLKFQLYGFFFVCVFGQGGVGGKEGIRRLSHTESGMLHGNVWLELSHGTPYTQSTFSLSVLKSLHVCSLGLQYLYYGFASHGDL